MENSSIFKVTSKQLRQGVVELEALKKAFESLNIDSAHKLKTAKQDNKLKIPGYYEINEICKEKTGKSFNEYFGFKRSVTKPRRIDNITNDAFISDLNKWCSENKIYSLGDYAACKNRPNKFPTARTIITNYGEDYFTQVLGLKRYKDTLEDKLIDLNFYSILREWCEKNDITSINRYNKAIKPKGFPSGERIRQIYGLDYFDQMGFFTRNYDFLSKADARQVCISNSIFTSSAYQKFYQFYNQQNPIKLPSDPYKQYNTNWGDFICLSDTQLFIGNSMSSMELFTYKLLHDRGIEFELEKSFHACRDKNPLPFDFYLPNIQSFPVIIELDGEQHRLTDINSRFFSKNIQEHDRIKDLYCKENGIKLIRIKTILDIEPALIANIDLNRFPKIKDLDWTTDFDHEDEVLRSNLSKSTKVRLLLLMAQRGKCKLTNSEIKRKTKIINNHFTFIKNELNGLGLINRPNEFKQNLNIDKVLELYTQGKSISEISKELGYSNRAYIVKRLKESAVNYKSKKTGKNEAAVLRKQIQLLYDQGARVTEIAKTIGKTAGYVSIIIKEVKIARGEIELDPNIVELSLRIQKGLAVGETFKELAEKLGRSKQYLKMCLQWTKKYVG